MHGEAGGRARGDGRHVVQAGEEAHGDSAVRDVVCARWRGAGRPCPSRPVHRGPRIPPRLIFFTY
jgi:hypothetical protein